MNRLQVRATSDSPSPLVSKRMLHSSYVQSACRESAAPRKIHDGGPNGRRQAVPVRDQLTECLVLPASFRPAQTALFINTLKFSV